MALIIKEILKKKGMTQKDLAKLLYVTDVTISKILNGSPNVSTLERVAAALGVEVWELFTASTDKGEFAALVKNGNAFYYANTLDQLEKIVQTLRGVIR